MYELFDTINKFLPGYMLIFARISAMTATLPIIGYTMVSGRIRIMFAFVLTLILFPMFGSSFPVFGSPIELLLGIAREVFIGLIIGFGAKLIFEAFNMAGSFVGRQMGLAIANVMDPTSQNQMPILSQFWMLVMIMFFLVANGHYLLIETIFKNFVLIPLGGGEFTPAAGQTIIKGGSMAFDIALRLAAPGMVFLLLVDVTIALTARVMPQMNIFLVTLPLKIGAGIFVLIFSLDIFQILFDSVLNDLSDFISAIVNSLK
ncbi:MAG: flagellar biosynthetic protein FliR [Candidatus Hatepunaea meridiana]|nr:flagellar biosynthetic protein FliR [Candidatus Hatepunaea meridiana]